MSSEVQYHCSKDELRNEIKILYFKQTVYIYIFICIYFTDSRPSDICRIVKTYLQITFIFFLTLHIHQHHSKKGKKKNPTPNLIKSTSLVVGPGTEYLEEALQRQQRLSLHHHLFTKARIFLTHVDLHLVVVCF